MNCPQCDHDAANHWPENGRVTSACVVCLDGQIVTPRSWDGGEGICCWPAADIRRAQ